MELTAKNTELENKIKKLEQQKQSLEDVSE